MRYRIIYILIKSWKLHTPVQSDGVANRDEDMMLEDVSEDDDLEAAAQIEMPKIEVLMQRPDFSNIGNNLLYLKHILFFIAPRGGFRVGERGQSLPSTNREGLGQLLPKE